MKSRQRCLHLPIRLRACFFATGAVIFAAPSIFAADGIWSANSSGLWSDEGNWSDGAVADGSGFSANFSTIDITSDHVVSLDSARTITNLLFADTTSLTPGGWTLDNNGSVLNTLTLAGTTPTITVGTLATGKTATISAVIEGTAGLRKSGTGTLVLSGVNTFTGSVSQVSGAAGSSGTIVVTNSKSLGNITGMNYLYAGGGTLKLDNSGTTADIVLNVGTIQTSGSSHSSPSIINVAGNNTIQSPLTVNTGGSNTAIQVDSGTLTMTGKYTGGSTARNIRLQGSGNGYWSGGIEITSNTFSKAGTGVWFLSGSNTYSGATSVLAGTLVLQKTQSKSPNTAITVSSSATLGLGVGGTGFFGAADVDALFAGTLAGVTNTATTGGVASHVGIDTTAGNFTYDTSISGTTRGLVKLGNNTLTLTGTNDYSQPTQVLQGALSFLTTAAKSGSSTVTVASGATLGLGMGASNFSSADLDNLFAGSMAGVTNDPASSVGIDTTLESFDYSSNVAATSRGLVKLGTNDLTLSGNNSFTGNVTHVTGGSLIITNSDSLGAGTKTIIFNTGGTATFKLDGSTGDITLPNSMTLQTSGLQPGGCIVNVAGNNVINGNITLNSGSTGTAIGVMEGTLTIAGDITRVASNTRGLRLEGAGNGTVSGRILSTVNGSVIKEGTGTWTLSNSNTYTSATTVNEGTLLVSGSLANSAVEVKSSATLAGTGPLGGNVTVRSGGRQAFTIAASAENQVTRSISGSLVLDEGNIVDLSADSPPANGSYILASATGGISGTLPVVNFAGGAGTVSIVEDTLVLTINPVSGYTKWSASHAGNQAADLDFDNDGVKNGVEYFMGIATPGFTANPVISGGVITWPKAATFNGSYAVKTSTDLMTWTVPIAGVVDDGSSVTYTLPSGQEKIFVRLEVVPAP